MPTSLPQLHLVRHGETAWTLSGRHTGRTDIPLTPAGEGAARALASRLGLLVEASPVRILTSPLLRARRTAELAGFADRLEIDPDLAEWDYGAYEGLTTPEIHAAHPGWNVFLHGCPRGESPDHVAARADRVIAKVLQGRTDVLVFAHGHLLRLLAARWLGLPPAAGRMFALSTAATCVLGHDHGRLDEPVVRSWNRTAD